jgi:hypothetical protein
MRVCTSFAEGGVGGLDAGAGRFWPAIPCAIATQTMRQRHARIFVENFINRRTPWSTERQAGSSRATFRLDATCARGAAPRCSAVETPSIGHLTDPERSCKFSRNCLARKMGTLLS